MDEQNIQETYHGIVYDLLFNQELFEKRRMSLAYISMILVLAHSRLACGTDRHAE